MGLHHHAEKDMSAERKENSVLFSLKELKEITADDPEPGPRAARPARRAVKTKRGGTSEDDADSLLADIRSTATADAEAEAARIEAERLTSMQSEQQRIEATATLQQEEIQARLAAEKARQRAAAEEREARLHQMDIEERRARGEIIEEPEAAPAAVAAPVAQVIATPAQIQPPQSGRSAGFYITVVVSVVCIAAVLIVLILTMQKEAPVNTPVAEKVAPVPSEPIRLEVSAPSPKPVAAAAQPDAAVAKAAPDAGAPVAKADKPKRHRGRHTRGNRAKKPPKKTVDTFKLDLTAE